MKKENQQFLNHAYYGPLQPERLEPLLPFASAMALLPTRCVLLLCAAAAAAAAAATSQVCVCAAANNAWIVFMQLK